MHATWLEPVTDDHEKSPPASFLNGKSAAAVFFALAYWVTVYCLPGSKASVLPPGFSWLFVGIAAFALTLSGLAVGRRAIVFDTLRVAASLPIVILFIGIASDPAGFAAGEDIRSQLVVWMGGVLGLSTAAEGLTQWVKIRGDANVTFDLELRR